MDLCNCIIWENWFKKGETKCLMLGLDYAGKSTILKKLNLDKYIVTTPIIGFIYHTIKINNFNLTIWNCLYWSTIPKLWKFFFSCHGLIFVLDSSDFNRIYEAKKVIHQLTKEEKLRDSIILLLANKQDIPNSLTKEKIIEIFEMKKVIQQECHVQCISAKTEEGIFEGLWWFGEQINKKIR